MRRVSVCTGRNLALPLALVLLTAVACQTQAVAEPTVGPRPSPTPPAATPTPSGQTTPVSRIRQAAVAPTGSTSQAAPIVFWYMNNGADPAVAMQTEVDAFQQTHPDVSVQPVMVRLDGRVSAPAKRGSRRRRAVCHPAWDDVGARFHGAGWIATVHAGRA